MGHKPSIQLLPERLPGITETLPSGVTVDTSTLIPGNDRKKLEDILNSFKNEG